MGKFGVGFWSVVVLGGIGSIFGGVGLLIGIVLGVLAGIGHDPEEAKRKNEEEKAKEINENEIEIETLKNNSLPVENKLYVDIVPEIIALCITANGKIEEQEIELATDFIENDDFILDQQLSLELLTLSIEQLSECREKSSAIFKLKATTIVHKVKNIKDSLQKERLLIILDAMLDIVKQGNDIETKSIVESIKNNINQPQLGAPASSVSKISNNSAVDNHKTNNTSSSNKKNGGGYSSLLKTGAAVAGGALIGNALAGSEINSSEVLSLDVESDSIEENDLESSLDNDSISEINPDIETDSDCDGDEEDGDGDDGGIFDMFDE